MGRVRLGFHFVTFLGMPEPDPLRRIARPGRLIALFFFVLLTSRGTFAQSNSQVPFRIPSAGGEVTLEADQQRQSGGIFYADGHVDIRYENVRLRADHVEYDEEAQVANARGHVELDYLTQHVEADD